MLNLLAKDFKLLFGKNKSISKKILSAIVSLIFVGSFVGIEVFLYINILKKIENTQNALMAFTTLFLFVSTIIIIFSCLVSANKLFFNEKDIEQLSVHPVDEVSIIFSKLLFLFITHFVLSFVTSFPIFLSYGLLYNKTMMFYYVGIFYPVLTFFFNVGIALIFVYPFWLLKNYLNKHIIIRFIVIAVVLFGFSFAYTYVLNMFVEIVVGGSFNSILAYVPKLVELQKYEFPTFFVVQTLFNGNNRYLFPFIAISLGVFMLGCAICIFAFNYVRNISISKTLKVKTKELKTQSVTKALIKKEFKLLTKNSDYSFSYLGLLVVQPLLAFLVIKALNTIFTTGVFAYYISVLPNFLPLLDVLILMFFTLIINQGANQYIQMEKKTIKLMKSIPVKFSKQIIIKVSIPFVLSFTSFFITLISLLIGRVIKLDVFFFDLLLVTITLFTYEVVSLKEELSIRNHKPRSTFVSNVYAYLLPVLYFCITAILSYFSLHLYFAFLIGFVVLLGICIPNTIHIKKNVNRLFMELDVIN